MSNKFNEEKKEDDRLDKLDMSDFSIKLKNNSHIDESKIVEKTLYEEANQDINHRNEYVRMLKIKKGEIKVDENETFDIFDGEAIKPITTEQKWNNYWYHYKLHTFFAAFGMVLLLMFAIPLIFAEKFDTTVLMLTEYPIEHEEEKFEAIFNKYVEDFDNNNQINTEFNVFQMVIKKVELTVNPEIYSRNQTKLLADIMDYHSLIMLVDDANYDNMIENFNMKYRDLTDLADSENINVQKEKFRIDNSNFAENFIDYDDLLKDLSLVIVDFDSMSDKYKNDEKFVKRYNEALSVLKMIINE